MSHHHQLNGARVSVIIPAYNRSTQVVEAVRSALHQTVPPFEIIVVDDGSMDDTPELFSNASAPSKQIRIVNSGVSVARNVGIRFLAWHKHRYIKPG
jgi:glycosyltransferase involved in cell wall biosynthesis